MARGIVTYFEREILPFMEAEFPDVLPQATIMVEGSVGLGLQDEWSDLDATIYLADDLWKDRGGQLQLALYHDVPAFCPEPVLFCETPGDPYAWPIFGHPEICVHPVSWLLDHHAEPFLSGAEGLPWEDVGIETLYALQHDLVVRDPHGVLATLKAATAPERYPEWLWRKRLIDALAGFKGVPLELEQVAFRGLAAECAIVLGPLLLELMQLGFLIERRYYPYRKHISYAVRELAFADDLMPFIEQATTGDDWVARAEAVEGLVRRLTAGMLECGPTSADVLVDLFGARGGEAWRNPDWRAKGERLGRLAREAGRDARDGWIWGLWGWG